MLFILLWCSLLSPAPADKPDWVLQEGKSDRYRPAEYLTGYASCRIGSGEDKAEAQSRAVDFAKENLIQQICVKIKDSVMIRQEERDQHSSSYVCALTQSNSEMEVWGLGTEKYIDDDQGACYALVYVKRDLAAATYGRNAADLRHEIANRLAQGDHDETGGQDGEALDEYLACYPLAQKLEAAKLVIGVVRGNSDSLAESDSAKRSDDVLLNRLDSAVQRVYKKPITTLDQLASYLLYCLNEKLLSDQAKVLFLPATYGATAMATPFSFTFSRLLEAKASEFKKWQVIGSPKLFQPHTADITGEYAQSSGADHIAGGIFWLDSGKIHVVMDLRRLKTNQIIACAEGRIDSSAAAIPQISLLPENYSQAYSDLKQFTTGDPIPKGLHLEAWTDKGDRSVVYAEGEHPEITVRAGQPCYLRIIDHLANGMRVLLVDNIFIPDSMVNKPYRIPVTFLCEAPFGAEVIQINAQAEAPFGPISHSRYLHFEVLDDGLPDILARMRSTTEQQAECRIQLTTVAASQAARNPASSK